MICSLSGSVGSTHMNLHSSRSHAIFTVAVECSEKGIDGQNHFVVGRLNLVIVYSSFLLYFELQCGLSWNKKRECDIPGGSGWKWASDQERGFRLAPEGSFENQLVLIDTGKRHFGSSRRKRIACPVQKFQADSSAAGFTRRQFKDADVRQHRTCLLQLRRNIKHSALCQSGQKHLQPGSNQRRSQRRSTQAVPERDWRVAATIARRRLVIYNSAERGGGQESDNRRK